MRTFREPIFNIPGAVVSAILILAGLYALQAYVLDPSWVLWEFSFIPARVALALGYDPARPILDALAANPDSQELAQQAALVRELVLEGDLKPWTLLTYALLHGSWTHLILNAIWLLAFGSAMARRFGPVRFWIFLAICAVAGALVHTLAHPFGVMPLVGASAAVSGCMAGAMRFAFQPGAPLGLGSMHESVAYSLPALPLRGVFTDGRVVRFLIVWFVLNLATGLAGGGLGLVDAAIAWEAHIGGFLAGLLLFPLFDPLGRRA